MDFPYTLKPQSMSKFFSHIVTAGVPEKVNQQYLRQSGFTSSNDNAVIKILKFINFLDSNNQPTVNWQQYRNKSKSGEVLGIEIKSAYSELFRTYPDANRKDNEAIRNYFGAHTSVGEKALTSMVQTFKGLCELAKFEIADASTEVIGDAEGPSNEVVLKKCITSNKGLTININIQLQIPETKESSVYDNFFASLKKNLLEV